MARAVEERTISCGTSMVDGVYFDIAQALKPGARENDIVALATMRLYGMIDKRRHRHQNVPHGSAPNWALLILGACAVAVVLFAGPLF